MTLEVFGSDGLKVENAQGVEAEVGNPFPEVVRETTDQGQVEWLNSSPTSSPEKKSPEA
jgi:hypothetical protein